MTKLISKYLLMELYSYIIIFSLLSEQVRPVIMMKGIQKDKNSFQSTFPSPTRLHICINTEPDLSNYENLSILTRNSKKLLPSCRSTKLFRLITVHTKERIFSNPQHKSLYPEHTWSSHPQFYLCQTYS